ncbi:MAG: hypothetical protein COX89_01915 [Candidatus Nealsonbacteria bacterium CG_4_10_14_0_2_um_filter_37_10]|uniref:Uncharacterized protein n=1 Tax=Candidatus Nealsonbacteria bacterium CG_4_10_14_0_2_um_filter_37_10 TaxID=1974679 RepID=A0A2M7UZH7_9BACT|nr:MAG: hypothetical protein COX89_01915 [Candidatus Nealsonbacteria bacterium CG_4_10_14_0_2_um_filter_37_10]
MTDVEFDNLITRAMDELPQEYIKGLDNVAIVMVDEPTAEQRQRMKIDNQHFLLGLYEGIPLTKRDAGYNLVLPDKITIFKNQIISISENDTEIFEQIKTKKSKLLFPRI